jgi:hypothetical protein
MLFAAVNSDLFKGDSVIYAYDFSEGTIKKISQGESSNPAIFSLGDKAILFNRHANTKNFRVLKLSTDESRPPAVNLNLATGDPIDVVAADSTTDTLILASPFAKRLQTLSLKSGVLDDLPFAAGFTAGAIRPVALNRVSDKLFISHSGLTVSSDGQGISDGTQQIYTAVINSGKVAITDLNQATSTLDGSPLTATFPAFQSNRGSADFKNLGLCNAQMQGCSAGIDSVVSGKAAKIASYSGDTSVKYVDQLVEVQNADYAYGLVENTKGNYIVGKISFSDGTVNSEIHTFGQKRLFGLIYEPGSQTLIVGDLEGDRGVLLFFKGDKLFKKLDLDGVFYRGALVN